MPSTYLDFPAFQATRTPCADLATAIGADFGSDDPVSGFIYATGCYIQNVVADTMTGLPTHLLHIERSEWMTDDLEELEKILWATHYLAQHENVMLNTVPDFTLDHYIQGACAAMGYEVDGDTFGVLFSGKNEWPYSEAEDIMFAWRDASVREG